VSIDPRTDRHRPIYHLTAPANWINDPNGVGHHQGRFHVYYQYNPNAAKWGDIHWGHASSADLVHWRDEPIALAPSPGLDEGGCFSGSFALVDGQPTLYYTGHTAERQVQCMATSDDMVRWTKHPQLAIVERPEGVEAQDFRDPYVFRHDGHWYLVVGAGLDHARGQCLLYRSDDGRHWQPRGALFTAPDDSYGVMWECPNFFPLGDRWVLVFSRWLGLGVHAFVGRFENERFTPEWEGAHDVDAGAFAHLAMAAPDGRCLQWAWMNEQREQALIDADGWAGALTVPRELLLDAAGRLGVRPVAEISRLRQAPLPLDSTDGSGAVRHRFEGRHLDIEARFDGLERDKVGLTLLASPDGQEGTRIVYWPDARRLWIERGRSSLSHGVRRQDLGTPLVLAPGEPLHLRVLLDASVLEVYANDRISLSTRLYPTREDSVRGEAWLEGRGRVTLQAWPMGPIFQGPRPPLHRP
jgi:beta-fructofuranosidase